MANIQTIRLVYHTAYLPEKEYIKTFLEFIGFQILEEACQSQDELNELVIKLLKQKNNKMHLKNRKSTVKIFG